MNPLKKSDIIKQTANELGLKESDVEQIVSAYYKEVRIKLTSLEHLHINVHGLGVFSILGYKVDNKIGRRLRALEKLTDKEKQESMIRFATRKRLEDSLQQCYNAKEMLEQEKVEQLKHKEIRKNYESNKNLES